MTVELHLRQLFLVAVVFIVALVYLGGVSGNKDLVWFWPFFNERPERIVVHRAGREQVLTPESPGYAEVTRALNSSLSKIKGYYGSLGLSPQTLQDYWTKETVVEVFYGKPVTIHTVFGFGHPDSLLIPLTGLHSNSQVVFGGKQGRYWAGALRLASTQPIKAAVDVQY